MMWCHIIPNSLLQESGRWDPTYFKPTDPQQEPVFPVKILKELVSERKGSVDPRGLKQNIIQYIGLENVQPNTGNIIGNIKRDASEIRSRSKQYVDGDVLYGRLRPELNKVVFIDGIQSGLCSNEFIILQSNKNIVYPKYLRYILASAYISSQVARFRQGAALPRIRSKDFLELEIPVPNLDDQLRILSKIKVLENNRKEAVDQIDRCNLELTKLLDFTNRNYELPA